MNASDNTRTEVAIYALAEAVAELRDALETIAGVVDLGAEGVFVRGYLDKATEALAFVSTRAATS